MSDFTREELERLANPLCVVDRAKGVGYIRDREYAAASKCALATYALALMDERDEAATLLLESKDAHRKTVRSAWRDRLAGDMERTARAADVAALRGCVGWMRLYSAPIVGGMIADARARIAAWDKDQCDG